jgi:hypothetical protein
MGTRGPGIVTVRLDCVTLQRLPPAGRGRAIWQSRFEPAALRRDEWAETLFRRRTDGWLEAEAFFKCPVPTA